ncbi:DUF4339 domain-containing protein [Bdellovibrio sp. HCB337]|uniref:DUF4339 domain-containing protein n=1 Tax=Bdellovibrio sp. HCB337 TaxID=3394358 RepID=UPI0039A6D8F2
MSSWYFNKNLKPQGPLDFDEMKRKIMRGEISPTDLIMKEGENSWQQAMEWRDFPQELFPAFQKNYFKKSDAQEKEWILLVFSAANPEGSQEGPYSVVDIQNMIVERKISIEDYVWRSGLTGWVQVKDRAEFAVPPTSLDL